MKPPFKKLFILNILTALTVLAAGQRTYKPSSVLSSGNWFKIAVSGEGVYKIDVPFLSSLGLTGTIPSNQIKIFGNGGAMLPEDNASSRIDDLDETAIAVFDGGDGVLNGNDYVLFYAKGPHQWLKDSANKRFVHQKNRYTNKAYYFITLGSNSKRISTQNNAPVGSVTVTSFDDRYFHEFDSVNFLNSGKEWYGEEFSSSPGRTLSRSFTIPTTDVAGPASIVSDVVSRSVGANGIFNVQVGSQQVQQISVPAVTGTYLGLFATETQSAASFTLSQSNAVVTFSYLPGSNNAQGWINWFEFFYRRNLSLPSNQQLLFRDWNSVTNNAATFIVANADANTQVWDVTDMLNPVKMNTTLSGSQLRFSNDATRLREYACFSTTFLVPEVVGRIANQDLHASSDVDFLLVTYPDFFAQAQRLAQFHQQHDGLRTKVVLTDQIFNEFASGNPDPTAIRDFVKMYYDKYRATWNQKGKYLLLFGKSSFDYKNRINGNTNFVPGFESANSLDPLLSYTSDDFFGFLDDNEDVNSTIIINTLDIGIGRIPAKNTDEAKNFVDKVEAYYSADALGPWRNNTNFIADDGDQDLHLQDAESITATLAATNNLYNIQKIYLDAFRKESSSAGGRYPGVNEMVNNNIFNGTLVWNYSGHGGPDRLAEEVVIDQSIINSWSNANKLPLFITATCDFAPYDAPLSNSLGENLLVRPKTGAIALMTTTRVVFASSNRIMNNNYLQIAFQPDANGKYKSLGEAVQAAKNYTYQNSTDYINNRKFALLGDPALTLAFPKEKIRATTINGNNITLQPDTLSATEFVTLQGDVTDNSGNVLNNFNGTVYLSLFDKPQTITTLGNDPASPPTQFQSQTSILFKGKATATAGHFQFKFRMPKDLNYQYGNGKLSLYAQNGVTDANGLSTNVIIGGININGLADNVGPTIKAYLNDEAFVNGGIVNPQPLLIIKLADSSGINTGNAGIGHDIVATLDDDNRKYYVLNDFYETDLDNYQRGTVRFQLPELKPGHHSLKIKAWDVVNNSSEYILDFTVINNDQLVLDHVLNYPNPFTTKTFFWFEHNRPATDLNVTVEIFTVAGKLIKTIRQTINSTGNRSYEVEWDGRDEWGSKIGKGVYLYHLRVASIDGKRADKWERLVVLN
ncbi:MAG: hypothetical protein C4329_11380 [Chitinophagaceae bacterium]